MSEVFSTIFSDIVQSLFGIADFLLPMPVGWILVALLIGRGMANTYQQTHRVCPYYRKHMLSEVSASPVRITGFAILLAVTISPLSVGRATPAYGQGAPSPNTNTAEWVRPEDVRVVFRNWTRLKDPSPSGKIVISLWVGQRFRFQQDDFAAHAGCSVLRVMRRAYPDTYPWGEVIAEGLYHQLPPKSAILFSPPISYEILFWKQRDEIMRKREKVVDVRKGLIASCETVPINKEHEAKLIQEWWNYSIQQPGSAPIGGAKRLPSREACVARARTLEPEMRAYGKVLWTRQATIQCEHGSTDLPDGHFLVGPGGGPLTLPPEVVRKPDPR